MNPLGLLRRRVLASLLAGVAVLVFAGHICAVPLDAHAGVVTTHETHAAPGNSEPGQDAAHAASCEVVNAPSDPGAPVAVVVSSGAVGVAVAPSVDRLIEADPLRVFGSPPLFLLHAALLI